MYFSHHQISWSVQYGSFLKVMCQLSWLYHWVWGTIHLYFFNNETKRHFAWSMVNAENDLSLQWSITLHKFFTSSSPCPCQETRDKNVYIELNNELSYCISNVFTQAWISGNIQSIWKCYKAQNMILKIVYVFKIVYITSSSMKQHYARPGWVCDMVRYCRPQVLRNFVSLSAFRKEIRYWQYLLRYQFTIPPELKNATSWLHSDSNCQISRH